MTLFELPAGPLSVLAIGAHPDDIEIGCGATLLMLAERGDTEIHTIILTGSPDREEEARSAAEAFGCSRAPVFSRFPDTRLPQFWAETKDALSAFREGNPWPDVIFVPRPEDAHQDHRQLGVMAPTVWRGPLVLHYEIPKWDGDLGRPNVYVPISAETATRKVALLNAAYPSQHQKDWWDDEFFLGIMRLRGAEAQTRYAEAFFATKLTVSLGQRLLG